MSFLYLGIIPRMVIEAFDNFVISLSDVMLLCSRYLITMISSESNTPATIAPVVIRFFLGETGALELITRSRMRFSGT